MRKLKRQTKQWPRISPITHRSGTISFRVDLGMVDGKRKMVPFATKAEADTFAEQARIKRANEGAMAFALPMSVQLDAAKAHQIVEPHGITILEAVKHYYKHFLAFKTAPLIPEVVQRYLDDAISRNVRPSTLSDLRSRLGAFAIDFAESRLCEVTVDDIKEWLNDDDWEIGAQTRCNYLTKLSQLFSYAHRRKMVDYNIVELIERPNTDETTPEIFTVEQAEKLLTHANEFDLLPYIAIGLFAGIRRTEMFRMNGANVNFESKIVTVSAAAAKKRSQRHIPMSDALLAWLAPCKEKLEAGEPIVTNSLFTFRKNMDSLLEAAGIETWPLNGLRHSFGSYHYEMFGNDHLTSKEMGNSAAMVHKHYKALVTKSDAEKYWALRPAAAEQQAA